MSITKMESCLVPLNTPLPALLPYDRRYAAGTTKSVNDNRTLMANG